MDSKYTYTVHTQPQIHDYNLIITKQQLNFLHRTHHIPRLQGRGARTRYTARRLLLAYTRGTVKSCTSGSSAPPRTHANPTGALSFFPSPPNKKNHHHRSRCPTRALYPGGNWRAQASSLLYDFIINPRSLLSAFYTLRNSEIAGCLTRARTDTHMYIHHTAVAAAAAAAAHVVVIGVD